MTQPKSRKESPLDLVRRFCDSWEVGDIEALMDFFSEDAVYHNIPMEAVTGKDNIAATINGFMGMVDKLEFRVSHIVAEGPVVLTERVDVFVTPNRTIELPVMGTFEIENGKIAKWRDYFDLNQFTSQMAGEWSDDAEGRGCGGPHDRVSQCRCHAALRVPQASAEG
ncbi:MAG: limonene-1,2-epoxide hydrolase family protein [Acidimicrobiales bacterium]